jgi:Domain of unknown function (DUF4395)
MTGRFTHWMRCNLSMQGYDALGDGERRRLGLALRLSPALCLTGMALGVVLESPAILLAMAATAFLGGFVTAKHPFDLIWDYGLRRLNDGPPLPPTPPPRRFACQIATVWLVAIAVAFLAGAEAVGLALGVPLLLVGAVVATTNWCLPSLVYGFLSPRLRSSVPRTS